MTHGGKREGAGRPAGAVNKDHRSLMREFGMKEHWLSPLEFCNAVVNNDLEKLGVIRNYKGEVIESIPLSTRVDAAKVAIPYMHQKLPEVVEHDVNHSWSTTIEEAERRVVSMRKQTAVDEDGRSVTLN